MIRRYCVVWTEVAARDYESILDYAAQSDGAIAATRLDAMLNARIVHLEHLPNRGRVVPELRAEGLSSFRELIVGSYRIIYRVHGRDVVLLAVVDGRRDLHDWLVERLTHAE